MTRSIDTKQIHGMAAQHRLRGLANGRSRDAFAYVPGVLVAICFALGSGKAWSDTLYNNGPANGTIAGWTISSPYVVGDTFTLTSNDTITGFEFAIWYFAGDDPSTVSWAITSAADGGTVYGIGTASVSNTFLFTNADGYDVGEETVSGLDVPETAGTYWLNLGDAAATNGDPLYWDENDGVGCTSPGCPSTAWSNTTGTIGSESFAIVGNATPIPEPGSMALLGSGLLVLGGVLRGRFRRRLAGKEWGRAVQ